MVKTSGKEYYYMVSGLMVPKYMVSETLPEDIEFFVDWVSKKAKILEHVADGKMDIFIPLMEELYKLLCSIHAHWLEMEASRILRLTDLNDKDLCLRLVSPFVANLHTLAIDIQMAQNRGFDIGYRQRNEIERFKSVISSVRIVASLVKSADYDKAFDAAFTIDELQESEYGITLMSGITSKSEEKTLKLIEEIIDIYTKKVDEVIDEVTNVIVLKKLLIVDDMPEVITALHYMLKDYYQIFAFTNGEDAIKFIEKKQNPDVFLLDIDMPDMDGFALAKRIREMPQYARTPLLFLTGNSTRETIMRSALYGAKAFIVKPANKDTIISKLSNCVN